MIEYIDTFFKIMFGILIGFWLGYKKSKFSDNSQD